MSSEKLKGAEKELADQMREYQATYDKKSAASFVKQGPKGPADLYEQIIKEGNEFRDGFHKTFFGKGCAIRDEFLWRLGKKPEQAEKDAIASLPPMLQITHGSLPISRALAGDVAGPNPVSDAADFLDGLARQLH
jgi:hypothetical protein